MKKTFIPNEIFQALAILLLTVGNVRSHILDEIPLVDGHNDLSHNLWLNTKNNLSQYDFTRNLTLDDVWGKDHCKTCHTDLPRLKQGKVGAQFWVAYTTCETQYRDAVERTLEQIDVIKQFISKYSNDLQMATKTSDIWSAFQAKKIASLIGVEGGHSIAASAGVLRMLYELGVRYMTLTHTCQTPWADSSLVDVSTPVHNLTQYGKKIILEMNRIGMLVDLSHVSHNVMNEAILTSRAPVIFSHSSSWTVRQHHRNVHDDTLQLLKSNGGIIMVNFYSDFISANPTNASIYDIIKHINYIVDLIGVDHVGFGSDFDGVPSVPKGVEDVSKFPEIIDLLAKLNATRWTDENLKKLAGGNFLRVFEKVEMTRESLSNAEPLVERISKDELLQVEELNLLKQCTTLLKVNDSKPSTSSAIKQPSNVFTSFMTCIFVFCFVRI